MAVPKQKSTKTRTHRRFRTWVRKEGVRIENTLKLVKCTNCGEKIKAHNVCPSCGYYKGKQMVKSKSKVVTTTKKVTAAKV